MMIYGSRARPLRHLWLRLAFLAGWIVALLTPASVARAAFEPDDASWEGGSQLVEIARGELGDDRVVVTSTLDWSSLEPSDALLILHPTVDLDHGAASAFLRAGGRVAVLDDFGSSRHLLARFDVYRAAPPRHPADALRGNRHLAVARPSRHFVGGEYQGRHPIVAGVSELITNHPTGLRHPNLTPVLTIPATGEPDVTLAVTGIIAGRGRLFAMGDPSAVINQMLRYPGNRAFARGLTRYLVEDDSWGKRQGRMVVVVNDFDQRGTFAGDGGLADELRQQVAGLADIVADIHDDGLPPLLALLLGALAAIAAAAWIGAHTHRIYERHVPRYARSSSPLLQGGSAGRAAILGAPTTTPALALGELKTGLLELLGHRFDLGTEPRIDVVVNRIHHESDDGGDVARRLEGLLRELERAELSIAQGHAYRGSPADLRRIQDEALAVLAELPGPRRTTRWSTPPAGRD